MGDRVEDRGERDRNDALAVERLAQGDASGISDLYERYGRTAYGLALKIVRDDAEAEDIVHDAFVAVCQRADQYHAERGTVAAWLVTTVRNLALDRVRRRSRRAKIVERDLKHELPQAPPGPEGELLGDQERRRVLAAMANLPAVQRETLLVAFFEGLSYPEIAERENVPLGTIKSRAARALGALRAALGSSEP